MSDRQIQPGQQVTTLELFFDNVAPFREGLMAGESIYFDLATLCEQAGLSVDEVRAAASARRHDVEPG
jgi:hypothetical protein